MRFVKIKDESIDVEVYELLPSADEPPFAGNPEFDPDYFVNTSGYRNACEDLSVFSPLLGIDPYYPVQDDGRWYVRCNAPFNLHTHAIGEGIEIAPLEGE